MSSTDFCLIQNYNFNNNMEHKNYEDQFESMYRKEQMLNQRVTYEKQCGWCKVIGGILFGGLGAFHGFRVRMIWSQFPMKEKAFNVLAVGMLGLFSAFNFCKAYEIQMGK